MLTFSVTQAETSKHQTKDQINHWINDDHDIAMCSDNHIFYRN